MIGALLGARRASTRLMQDNVTISRESGRVLDTGTGLLSAATVAVIYVGMGRLEVGGLTLTEAGERKRPKAGHNLWLPWDAVGVFELRDTVTVSDSLNPELPATRYVVIGELVGSTTSRRTLEVQAELP